jgi:hypothetical protein
LRRTKKAAQYAFGYCALRDAMPSPITLIMRQFLAWVAERPRRREEVREAWRSCPRISVWEDAMMEELVAYDGEGLIRLTARGRDAVSDVRDQMSEVRRRLTAVI